MSANKPTVLMLAGDVMTGRGIDQAFARRNSPELYEPWVRDAREYLRLAEEANGPLPLPIGPDYVWGEALAELARAKPDCRIVNLETAVTTASRPWPGKGIHYRMHPANVGLLGRAGIDCCVLANNHVMDWGREGLAETLSTLAGAGVRTAGAGADAAAARAPAVFPLAGGRRLLVFARAAASSGVPDDWAAGDDQTGVALVELTGRGAEALSDEILAFRRPGDLAVVSLHWGGNWVPQVPEAHRAFARRLIDSRAADLVHGHSSHHPMPAEVHRGRLVLHGCGDLVNDYEGIGPRGELRSDLGCLYFATLADDGALLGLRMVPLQLRRFSLSRPDADARDALLGRLNAGGRELGSRLEPDAEGGWQLRWRA